MSVPKELEDIADEYARQLWKKQVELAEKLDHRLIWGEVQDVQPPKPPSWPKRILFRFRDAWRGMIFGWRNGDPNDGYGY